MPAARSYARVVFDEPAVGPLDVKVFDGAGNLLRIIPGAVLRGRVMNHQRAPETPRPSAPVPHVPMVKAKTRAGRP